MAELANVLAGFLDAIGVAQVSVCGQHTGASLAAELARRHPTRVRALALDGLPLFSADEQRSILPHQLYRFVPQVDGTHLMWAWSRFRDGWIIFPWSQRDRAHRRVLDFPDARLIHDMQIVELLRSRENHLRIYPGVFAWDGAEALATLRQPMWIGTTADDQLSSHLDRLPALPPDAQVQRLPIGARAEVLQAQARWMIAHLPDADAPPAPSPQAHWRGPHGLARAHVAGLSVRGQGMGRPGSLRLLLHGAGSSAQCELQRWPDDGLGPVLAIDLPGHGDSQGEVQAPAGAATALARTLGALGLPLLEVWGRGYGAAVAIEWARQCARAEATAPCRPQSLHLCELLLCNVDERTAWADCYATPIEPGWDGSHLVRLWHEIRDRELFHPWFERSRAHIRPVEPVLDAESLTQSVFAALCCQDWVQAHRHWLTWRPQTLAELRSLGVAFDVHVEPGDGWAHGLDAWRGTP